MSDSILPHCFLYCAQVLWEKTCLYNKSCSYGNQEGCVFVEQAHVCLAQTGKSTVCVCATLCLHRFTKERRGQWMQTSPVWSLCDGGMKVDPLTFHARAHTLFHRAQPFDDSVQILSLSSWTVALDASEQRQGRQTSRHTMGVAPALLSALWYPSWFWNKELNPPGSRFASAASQQHQTSFNELWISHLDSGG